MTSCRRLPTLSRLLLLLKSTLLFLMYFFSILSLFFLFIFSMFLYHVSKVDLSPKVHLVDHRRSRAGIFFWHSYFLDKNNLFNEDGTKIDRSVFLLCEEFVTSVSDPDPYQETLIWIRVPKRKIVINSHTNQPKL